MDGGNKMSISNVVRKKSSTNMLEKNDKTDTSAKMNDIFQKNIENCWLTSSLFCSLRMANKTQCVRSFVYCDRNNAQIEVI